MAIVIEQIFDDNGVTLTSYEYTYSVIPSENSLVLFIIVSTERGTTLNINGTGWTQEHTALATPYRETIFWKIASASEPTSVIFTSDLTENIGWLINGYELSGIDTSAPINQSVYDKYDSTLTPTIASITPSVDNCLILSGFDQGIDTVTLGLDAELTQRFNTNTAGRTVYSIGGSLLQTTAQATGIYTHSSTSTANAQQAYNLAIAPSGAEPDNTAIFTNHLNRLMNQ